MRKAHPYIGLNITLGQNLEKKKKKKQLEFGPMDLKWVPENNCLGK